MILCFGYFLKYILLILSIFFHFYSSFKINLVLLNLSSSCFLIIYWCSFPRSTDFVLKTIEFSGIYLGREIFFYLPNDSLRISKFFLPWDYRLFKEECFNNFPNVFLCIPPSSKLIIVLFISYLVEIIKESDRYFLDDCYIWEIEPDWLLFFIRLLFTFSLKNVFIFKLCWGRAIGDLYFDLCEDFCRAFVRWFILGFVLLKSKLNIYYEA